MAEGGGFAIVAWVCDLCAALNQVAACGPWPACKACELEASHDQVEIGAEALYAS